MQTFLPSRSFKKSAEILDFRRLNKQRSECVSIYNIITRNFKIKNGKLPGYIFHPATIMWLGYHDCLAYYFNCIRREWINRGYVNNMPIIKHKDSFDYPPFIGIKIFHSTHRAKLLGKNFNFYKKYGWAETPMSVDKPYFWPSVINKETNIVTHMNNLKFKLHIRPLR